MSQPEDNPPGPDGNALGGNGEAEAGAESALELTFEGQLEDLHNRLEQQIHETERFRDLYTRERADLENFKRRMQREKADTLRFAAEPLVRDLLPVVDNLERALDHAEVNPTSVVEGVKLVFKALLEVLERHGTKRIDVVGQPFDPTQHQAIAQVDSVDHAPNHVIAQHQPGYMLHDRLLRAAMVTVSGRKSSSNVESDTKRD